MSIANIAPRSLSRPYCTASIWWSHTFSRLMVGGSFTRIDCIADKVDGVSHAPAGDRDSP